DTTERDSWRAVAGRTEIVAGLTEIVAGLTEIVAGLTAIHDGQHHWNCRACTIDDGGGDGRKTAPQDETAQAASRTLRPAEKQVELKRMSRPRGKRRPFS